MTDPYGQYNNRGYQTYPGYAPQSDPNQPPEYDSRQYPPPTEGPNYRWFVPSEGIRRDVIQADLQRYLGNDAVMKVGYATDNVCSLCLA
jgi:hypothetical protein